MFSGTNFTSSCWNAVKAEADPQGYMDARGALVGNAFHSGVVAALLAPLLVQEGFLGEIPSPSDLVDRMGLAPGEVYYPGLNCRLDRPPIKGRFDGRERGRLESSSSAAAAAVDPASSPELEKLLFHSLVRSADY